MTRGLITKFLRNQAEVNPIHLPSRSLILCSSFQCRFGESEERVVGSAVMFSSSFMSFLHSCSSSEFCSSLDWRVWVGAVGRTRSGCLAKSSRRIWMGEKPWLPSWWCQSLWDGLGHDWRDQLWCQSQHCRTHISLRWRSTGQSWQLKVAMERRASKQAFGSLWQAIKL